MKQRNWISIIAWFAAALAVLAALAVAWRVRSAPESPGVRVRPQPVAAAQLEATANPDDVEVPTLRRSESLSAVAREVNLHTIIPNRPREEVRAYEVDFGDSVFGIAQKFGITPETVLWANYDLLDDNPDLLTPGMVLNIPPVNGVYYQWQEGDDLEAVATRFEASRDDILEWPGNELDLVDPEIEAGQYVMVPGGHREFRQWIIPTIPRGRAGVSPTLYGPGACEGGYEGAYGSGAFVYPSSNHTLSGNDYWSGHLGIDLAAAPGAGVYAADSGVVVFSGWATGGYGYMVMIDHGNGYQSLYAHLSQTRANCGQSVSQGQVIATAGSTGNSTGPHLHFEVRFQGGFVNPWFVLPAP